MASTPTTPNIPRDWTADETAWEIDGSNIVDKSNLLGIPFRITAVSFRLSARELSIVYCDIEYTDLSTATFTDASTGVKAQLDAMWHAKTGEEPTYSVEEVWYGVSIIARQGLRVSSYQREGSRETSRTYYLTSNGRRPTSRTVQAVTGHPVASEGQILPGRSADAVPSATGRTSRARS